MTTILITGANRGLGLEFVTQYAKDGATIHAACRRPEKAKELIELANAHKGKITVHTLDAASDASVAHLKREIGDTPIDILINNAGVYGGDKQNHGGVDFSSWLDVLNVNTLGPIRVMEALAGNLNAGTDKKAIAITSMMGSTAGNSNGGYLAYRSSKAALNNALRGLSLALKGDGVIVVPIHPGWVQTDMGGPNAPLKPPESVSGMRKVIADLKLSDSGRFLDYAGKELPW
jgi:NAD(P)-dependent dehydrogenase (short-subunit alcohol dehydrogenase family)